MPRQQTRSAHPRRGRVAASLTAEAVTTEGFDAVHVRNYDHETRHSVGVTLETTDGDEVLADRHTLSPGQSSRMSARLELDEYVLRVRVDGVERRRRPCRLGPEPVDTAVVELGNGAVSVTTGVRGSLAFE